MLEKYYRINQAAGIAIHIHSDGGMTIALCGVKAEGNELNLDKKITGLHSVAEVKKHLPEKSMIALNLSGKGVLYKQTEKVETLDQAALSKLFPNANLDDFYVQNFNSGNHSHITLIRKAEADRWLSQLTQMGMHPLMLSLGPFPVAAVLDQLNFYEGDFNVNGHSIGRDSKGTWTSYQYGAESSPFQVKLASENMHEALILPYAAAFQLILAGQIDPVHAEAAPLASALRQKLEENKVKVHGFLILVVFFVLLLANYLLFSWLAAANSKLDAQVSLNDQNTDSLTKIEEVVKGKEAKLTTLGWDGGIDKSVLIDQIASLMPREMTLTEIGTDPIDLASSREQKSIVFFRRKLLITGHSDQIVPVNEWIARIKTRPWVKKIGMDSYTFDSEHNTGKFLITIDF
jgi:hypothetical protein